MYHDGLLALGRQTFLELLRMSHSYTRIRLTLESYGSIRVIWKGSSPVTPLPGIPRVMGAFAC